MGPDDQEELEPRQSLDVDPDTYYHDPRNSDRDRDHYGGEFDDQGKFSS